MNSAAKHLAATGVVPVIVLEDASQAQDIVAALAAGGVTSAEITLRTPAGIEALRSLEPTPGFMIGAGTVLTLEDVDRSVAAGAEFLVSPGFDERVVERALELDVPIFPGIATATEVQRALRAGVTEVKFFPAHVLGGLRAIRALAEAFPKVRFMPSGGVGPGNVTEYLADPAVFAVAGSWMTRPAVLAARDFGEVQRQAAATIRLVSGADG